MKIGLPKVSLPTLMTLLEIAHRVTSYIYKDFGSRNGSDYESLCNPLCQNSADKGTQQCFFMTLEKTNSIQLALHNEIINFISVQKIFMSLQENFFLEGGKMNPF